MPARRSADARAGRLEAVQVRAMFDRVAGVYDLLNTVMTAGLHHRWRERAVDFAEVGPGDRVLDVATGTGDLAIELARRGLSRRGGGRQRLLRGNARARSAEGRQGLVRSPVCRLAWEQRCVALGCCQSELRNGATRWNCPTRTTASTPPRWGLGRATSPTWDEVFERWRAWCVLADASWCSR